LTIIIVLLMTIGLIQVGKRSKEMRFKEYGIIVFVTLVQIAVFIVYLYTMEPPPLLR
jgi:hypothetical protein